MCCVVGYVGSDTSRERICEGLLRLEYRGYDSAGFACITDLDMIASYKAVGGVTNLRAAMGSNPSDGHVGIGHTRWATHGAITEHNAHPVFDCAQTCAVVHNGVIDGEKQLRQELSLRGHRFVSQTDSELIAHLFEEIVGGIDSAHGLPGAIAAVIGKLHGSFACAVLLQKFSDCLVAVRRRSPLCVGLSDGGSYVASDPLAFAGTQVNRVLFLPDESFALVYRDRVYIYNFNGIELKVPIEPYVAVWEGSTLQGHAHYMLKEIYEQPAVIAALVRNSPRDIMRLFDSGCGSGCADATEYLLFACGASFHAAHIAQYYLQSIADTPARVILASELRYHKFLFRGMPWAICLSQSGETADVLEAMRQLKTYGIVTLGLVNRSGSTVVREAEASLLLHAGHEIAVASTKTFVAHLSVLYLLAHALAAYRKGRALQSAFDHPSKMLRESALFLQQGIESNSACIERTVVPLLLQARGVLVIGRREEYGIAQELALKLKEIAYIFAEACYAGELKHGPLALIDGTIPVIVCAPLDDVLYARMITTVHEAKLRGGKVIVLCFQHQHELVEIADVAIILSRPTDHHLGPLVMAGVAQYIAYAAAVAQGLPIDRPRNLAKSVTVE